MESQTYPFLSQQVVDLGDIACSPFNISEALAAIEGGVREALDIAPRIVVLGGDHTIALPVLRALHAVHGPISVVHFDAHLDTWDAYFGQAYHHGTPFRRASEEGLIDREGSVHVGVRGAIYGEQDLTNDRVLGFMAVRCIDIHLDGVASALERVRARVQDRPVYVSVDIDVLDTAFAPGTGTPEAGGLASWQLLHLIRSFRGLNVVGMDVVEVAPAYDHASITAVAASHVAYEMLGAWAPSVQL